MVPVTPLTPFWYEGRAKYSDVPPPVANGAGCVEPVQTLVSVWL